MVEQRPFKPLVVGSIPTAPTKRLCPRLRAESWSSVGTNAAAIIFDFIGAAAERILSRVGWCERPVWSDAQPRDARDQIL